MPYTSRPYHRHRLARDAAYTAGGASLLIILFTAFCLLVGFVVYAMIWLSYIAGVALIRGACYPWHDRDWYPVLKEKLPWTMYRESLQPFWSQFKGYR